jgi:hypothetical protein
MLLIQINEDCDVGRPISFTQAEPAASWFLEGSPRTPKFAAVSTRKHPGEPRQNSGLVVRHSEKNASSYVIEIAALLSRNFRGCVTG